MPRPRPAYLPDCTRKTQRRLAARDTAPDGQGFRGCGGKVAHPSKAAARAEIRRMLAQYGPSTLSPYKCRICGKWHTGRRGWTVARGGGTGGGT